MYLEQWTLTGLGKEAELTLVTMLKCVEVAVAVQRGLDQLQKVAAITVNIIQTRGESYLSYYHEVQHYKLRHEGIVS
jgi:hypothetical protein